MTRYRFGRRFIEPQHRYRRWIDRRVFSLRLAPVLAYLRSRGWTEVPPDRPGFLVFQEPPGPGGGPSLYYQFVPEHEDAVDYPQDMFELITGLAEVEDRQASEVLDDILRHASTADPNGAAQQSSSPAQPVNP